MELRPLAIVLLAVGLAGCGARVDTDALPEIPEVQTADFLPAVREQLHELRNAVASKPRSGTAAGKLGMAFMAYRQYEAAAAAFERAQLLQPRKWQWQYLRAIVLSELGDYPGAVALLEQVARHRPDELLVRTRLGLAYTKMGELERAEQLLSAVAAEDPQLAEASVGAARALIRLDRPAEALEHLERLLDLYGPSATTYFAMAEASRRLGDAQRSQHYYDMFERYRGVGLPSGDKVVSAVRRLDRSEKLLTREARRLIAMGESQKAIAIMHQALERNPDSVMIRGSLVSAYGAMKQFDKADEQYQLALESGPPNAVLLRSLGQARTYESRFEEARAALEQSLEINPQDAVTHAWLGIVSRGQGRNAQAIESFSAALDIDPGERTARLNIAELLLRERRFDDAIGHLQFLLTPESDATITALFFMGQALASKGQFAQARVRFNEAIEVATRRGNNEAVVRVQALLAKLP